MRRLLAALIALSLSWVTTSYACLMGPAVVRPVCCCEEGLQQPCPNPSTEGASGVMTGTASDEGCCSVVTSSGTAATGQAESSMRPDLPQFVALAEGNPGLASIEADLPVVSHRPAHDRSAPAIYILFGHLLR